MNYFLALFAGAIQGLTEFLPISSTGHLIIFENVFKISQKEFGLAFDASLHLGTLLAVLIFFYKDYLSILNFKNNLLIKLIIGTIPAAILGLIFESFIENQFRSLALIGYSMVFFSFIMVAAEIVAKIQRKDIAISKKDSFIVGLAQSLALVPGISRSGATISAGLFLGQTRASAARFAFLLSGPIIAGAGSKKFFDVAMRQNLTSDDLRFFIIGIISSAIFGYLTIKYFLKYLQANTLYPFIAYRIILGLILVLLPLLIR